MELGARSALHTDAAMAADRLKTLRAVQRRRVLCETFASSALTRSIFLSSSKFAADDRGPFGERPQFAEGALARQVLHAAIRRRDEALGRHMPQPLAQPRGHGLGG